MDWLEKFDKLNHVLTTLLGVSFGSGLTMFIKSIYKKYHDKTLENKKQYDIIKSEVNALKIASKSLLHNELYTLSMEALNRGVISIDEIDNLNHLYTAYMAFGDSPTITVLMDKVLKLEIIEGSI